jgi:DivIVA domain-containing protein
MKHNSFPRTPRLRRGYHGRQVDSFLANVEASLQGHLPPMAAADIRRAGFELVRHGYQTGPVDAHLDVLEERLLAMEGATGGRRGRTDPESDLQFLRDRLDKPYMRRFPRSRMLRRGYDLDEVDEFVDRVLAGLNVSAGTRANDLTVDDVRNTGFKPRRGGYAEDAVDETLDRVVEMLLVQRREMDGPWTGRAVEPDVEAAGPAI